MTHVRCNNKDCYWKMDGYCSLSGIEIKDYHCSNYRTYNITKVIEHYGYENEHYWYCSNCGSKDVYEDDKYCSSCGVKFKEN